MQSTTPATAPTPPAFAERTSEHLYAIVHRWPGTCQPQEQLQPPEQSLARDEDAREVLALGYLADLRLRFVFTQPGTESMALARASDLTRLDLTEHDYFLVSAHREENVDTPDNLRDLLAAYDRLLAHPAVNDVGVDSVGKRHAGH